MLQYNQHLREPARDLRKDQTPAEELLWARLRRRQVAGVQFYRQKPLLTFIVDFYCHAAKLVVELDGWHHAEVEQFAYDDERTIQLNGLGIKVMRSTSILLTFRVCPFSIITS